MALKKLFASFFPLPYQYVNWTAIADQYLCLQRLKNQNRQVLTMHRNSLGLDFLSNCSFACSHKNASVTYSLLSLKHFKAALHLIILPQCQETIIRQWTSAKTNHNSPVSNILLDKYWQLFVCLSDLVTVMPPDLHINIIKKEMWN